MDFPFPVVEVVEGTAHLLVPDVPRRKGPGKAGPWPFYNPTMAVNRDLCAMVLAEWPHPLRSILDGLAATGAWGIRMAREAGRFDVTFNDRSGIAADLIRENVRRNGLAGDVRTGGLPVHLRESSYDFVDIDPFGPPTPFLEAALDSATIPSGIGITATDTAVLSGTYPEACRRRYGARPMRCAQSAEIGLRILLGYCARIAGEREKSIHPILSFAAEHFLRVHLIVEPHSASDFSGPVVRRDSGNFVSAASGDGAAIGPLWLGRLGDPRVIHKLAASAWTSIASARLLSLVQAESELPPFFATTDELAARERGSPPRLERFIEGIHSIGYRAARTHFHPRGVKTDAPYADLRRVFREQMPSGSTDG